MENQSSCTSKKVVTEALEKIPTNNKKELPQQIQRAIHAQNKKGKYKEENVTRERDQANKSDALNEERRQLRQAQKAEHKKRKYEQENVTRERDRANESDALNKERRRLRQTQNAQHKNKSTNKKT